MRTPSITLLLVLLLSAVACGVFGVAAANVGKYYIDANMAYQQQPVVVLERQMESIQANSPSNAPSLWPMVFITIGAVAILFAGQWERITMARTAYLKEKTKHNRAKRPTASGQPVPLRTLTPIQPLNPYRFQPAPTPPALPASGGNEPAEDGEQW